MAAHEWRAFVTMIGGGVKMKPSSRNAAARSAFMSISIPQTLSAVEHSAGKPDDFIWRLSVAQYHEMIRSGILTSNDPVELLAGWLVHKMPKNPPHRIATRVAQKAIEAIIPAGWYVDAQEPITLEDSEPEPDVAVVRGETRLYRDRHPGPEDIALVVEVADTTLERDRGVKRRVYARAGIPIYWIINLVESVIEVYQSPSGTGEDADYAHRREYSISDLLPVVIERHEVGSIAARELLS
jgi:Uma2 family endonuclease